MKCAEIAFLEQYAKYLEKGVGSSNRTPQTPINGTRLHAFEEEHESAIPTPLYSKQVESDIAVDKTKVDSLRKAVAIKSALEELKQKTFMEQFEKKTAILEKEKQKCYRRRKVRKIMSKETKSIEKGKSDENLFPKDDVCLDIVPYCASDKLISSEHTETDEDNETLFSLARKLEKKSKSNISSSFSISTSPDDAEIDKSEHQAPDIEQVIADIIDNVEAIASSKAELFGVANIEIVKTPEELKVNQPSTESIEAEFENSQDESMEISIEQNEQLQTDTSVVEFVKKFNS